MSFTLVLDNLRTFLEIVAILAGGTFAYMKFVHGRLFQPKLDIEADGKEISVTGKSQVLVCVRVKNVGFSRVIIDEKTSVLRVFIEEERLNLDFTDAAMWRHIATVPLLKDHEYIDPLEVVREEDLFCINDKEQNCLRFEITVSSVGRIWRASTIVTRNTITQL